MFKKILIANRGEIACRIMATAKKLNILTVAVYSSADTHSKHVEMADEAIWIGEAPAHDSYLNIEKIITAAQSAKAEAIHPGYGFLSENPEFSAACQKAGIVFIGPSPEAIAAMGNKDQAKKIMAEAGIPITPGKACDNPEDLFSFAKQLGLPVLIKAQAGGGGKGMRVVEDFNQFSELMASAQREAKASFNDDRVFIEKYLTDARHIEVQICRDQQGNTVHLFDRDCSVQRRQQKIIEEAPAIHLDPALRDRIFQAACAAANSVDYLGVGTVEFLVTPNNEFYFMEMNTRLQVEHPVTEQITSVDLVEWQIRVANGEALPLQEKIHYQDNHSIEIRLCAEDPSQDFKPSTGIIRTLVFPENNNCRIESGYRENDKVTVYYDSLLAKLITTAKTRKEAILAMIEALQNTFIIGIATNRQYLISILTHPDFMESRFNTRFLNDFKPVAAPDHIEHLTLFSAAACYLSTNISSDSFSNFRLNQNQKTQLTLFSDKEAITISWQKKENHWIFFCNDYSLETTVDISTQSFDIFYVELLGLQSTVLIKGHELQVQNRWQALSLSTELPIATDYQSDQDNQLKANMPSTVVSVLVKPKDSVKTGDPLIILEAMKIEQTITAPKDGVIKTLFFGAGDVINEGELLLEFE